jgi:hypothetical protein
LRRNLREESRGGGESAGGRPSQRFSLKRLMLTVTWLGASMGICRWIYEFEGV